MRNIILTFIGLALLCVFIVSILNKDTEELGAKGDAGQKDVTLEEKVQLLFDKYGDYIQVTSDGRTLYKDSEIVETDFKNSLPSNTVINVYIAPCGKGYEIVTNSATSTVSKGFGCEGPSRTYTFLKTVSATST